MGEEEDGEEEKDGDQLGDIAGALDDVKSDAETLGAGKPVCCKCKNPDKDGKPVYSCSTGGSCRYCKQFGGQKRAIMKPAPPGGRCSKGIQKGANYDCRKAFENSPDASAFLEQKHEAIEPVYDADDEEEQD